MKTLFIGLGGNGVKAVSSIRKQLQLYYKHIHQTPEILRNPNLKLEDIDTDEYLFIDTNQNEILSDPTIDLNNDAIILNTTSSAVWRTENLKNDNSSRRFFEWYDETKAQLSNTPLDAGAGAVRMIGRLGLFAYKERFEDRIRTKITNLNLRNDGIAGADYSNLDSKIYVFSGTSGGTGSGMLFDVLMTIYRISRQLDAAGDPEVITVLFGPQQTINIETNADVIIKKKRNAAAFFKELDAYSKFKISKQVDNANTFNSFSSWIPNPQLTDSFPISSRIIYVDNTFVDCNKNTNSQIGYSTMHDIVSDIIFNMESGSINKNINNTAGAAAATLTGLLVNANGLNVNRYNGYNDLFQSFAPFVLQFPKELFTEYCNIRFKKDFISNLIGEHDKTSTQVDHCVAEFSLGLNNKIKDFTTSLHNLYQVMLENNNPSRTLMDTLEDELDFQQGCIKPNAIKLDFINTSIEASINEIKHYIEQFFKSKFGNLSLSVIKLSILRSDENLTILANELKGQINHIPSKSFRKSWSKYFEDDLWEYLCKYVKIEVYNKCSYQSTGLLDKLFATITTFINNFDTKLTEADKAYNSEFISSLNKERANSFKIYLPSLDEIIKSEITNVSYIPNNPFEEVYKSVFTKHTFSQLIQESVQGNELLISSPFTIYLNTNIQFHNIVNSITDTGVMKFKDLFASNQTIKQYQNQEVLPLLETLSDKGKSILEQFNGFNGVLFPAVPNQIANNPINKLLIGKFDGNNKRAEEILEGAVIIDDPFYTDKLVAIYLKNDLSPEDLAHIDDYNLQLATYLNNVHPAFIDKKYEYEDILSLFTTNSVEQNPMAILPDQVWVMYMLSILAAKYDKNNLIFDTNKLFIVPNNSEYSFDYKTNSTKFTLKISSGKIELIFPKIEMDALLNIETVEQGELITITDKVPQSTPQSILHCLERNDLSLTGDLKWIGMFKTLLNKYYSQNTNLAGSSYKSIAEILNNRSMSFYDDLTKYFNA